MYRILTDDCISQDEKIKGHGVVNEGVVSTRLGLKGIPNLAEELQIARNLFY
jgi:dihydroorotase